MDNGSIGASCRNSLETLTHIILLSSAILGKNIIFGGLLAPCGKTYDLILVNSLAASISDIISSSEFIMKSSNHAKNATIDDESRKCALFMPFTSTSFFTAFNNEMGVSFITLISSGMRLPR